MECKDTERPMMNYKKGLWSPDEDQRLTDYVLKHGYSRWSSVPTNAGLQRNGKSCRLRWLNYLRPGLKHGRFSRDEEETVLKLHTTLGNKWSKIAIHLPGRTDNEIKNYWNSYLRKRAQPTASSKMSNSKVKMTSSMEELDSSVVDSADINQNSSKTAAQVTALPRVMFADWLSMNNFNDAKSFPCTSELQHNEDFHQEDEDEMSNLDITKLPISGQFFDFSSLDEICSILDISLDYVS